jgi:hypothetical protein
MRRALHGEAARAAGAVDTLERALRDGDVEDLAMARVRIGSGSTIPLDIVRSGGLDPIGVVNQAMR